MSDFVAPDPVEWESFLQDWALDETPSRARIMNVAHAQWLPRLAQPPAGFHVDFALQAHENDHHCSEPLSSTWTTQPPDEYFEHLFQAKALEPCQVEQTCEAFDHKDMSDEHQYTPSENVLSPVPGAAKSSKLFACSDCAQTFTRKSDLRRHESSKHAGLQRFDCPEVNCRYRGKRANTRRDKFISHLRKGHPRPEKESWLCPHSGCGIVLHELDLLAVHIHVHGRGFNETASAVRDAILEESISCPLSDCKKHRKFANMAAHLKNEHTSDQREAQAADIQAYGLSWHDCCYSCPVCPVSIPATAKSPENWVTLSELENLRKHIATEHLLLASTCLEPFSRARYSPTGLLRCESCALELGSDVQAIRAHMREHIRDPREIFPFREQIFKIWPAFAYHPVFDDLRPAEWFTTTNFQDWRMYGRDHY